MPVDFTSPTYPFKRIISSNTFKGAEKIPYKILLYLMDLPDANGYTPPDNNDYPRCRLKKYLWYDEANPLSKPLPSAKQIQSILFDPTNPDINTDEDKAKHPKGYRLFWQRIIGQSELDAKTLIKCYPGNISEPRKFMATIGINFEIWNNVNFVTNTRTTSYDRTFDIEQCLHEALEGVDIAGVGTVSFARADNVYNGSEPIWTDSTLVGRIVKFSVNWAESGKSTINCH